jgi:hypothetical protein
MAWILLISAGLLETGFAVLLDQALRLGPRLPGGTVYTDDRAPVEWLVDRSILGYAAR